VETIPIAINGIGLREGTLTFMFSELDLDPEHGLVLGLTITVMRYVAGLVGGLLLAFEIFIRKNQAASRSRKSEV